MAVTAAGHYEMAPISEGTVAQWQQMFAEHLSEFHRLSRAALPRMLKDGNGSIVDIGRELAVGGGGPDDAHYAACIRSATVGSTPKIGERASSASPSMRRQSGVHSFTDGNGRATRLLADLGFAAAQVSDVPELYDWQLDKRRYISLLRQYDAHRDPRELASFVGIQPLKR